MDSEGIALWELVLRVIFLVLSFIVVPCWFVWKLITWPKRTDDRRGFEVITKPDPDKGQEARKD